MASITAIKDKINQMNDADFQILCDRFLTKKIGKKSIVCLGTKEGSSKVTKGTPDTYFIDEKNKYIFCEYTTQKSTLVSKIRKDIEKCLNESITQVPISEISQIIYCHSSSNILPKDDLNIRNLCKSCGIQLNLIGIDKLAEELMHYPYLVKDHLNITIDTEQIQSVEDFLHQYNSNRLAASLNTKFISRKDEINRMNAEFKDNDIVILVGKAGTGKTRLAIEYALQQINSKRIKTFVIHNKALPLYNDLKMYLDEPGSYFLVIDDADQLMEIEHVIEYVNKKVEGYDVKILITVRDYALESVHKSVSSKIKNSKVEINKFSDDEINVLMINEYGIKNENYLNRILSIAEGNARIAMLTGEIVVENKRLDSINDLSEVYELYFSPTLEKLNNKHELYVTLGIMSFLTTLHLEKIDVLKPILDENNIDTITFKNCLEYLHTIEVLDIYKDKVVKFSDQCFSNYILKKVFYDKKIICLSKMIGACFKPFSNSTIVAISRLLSVFKNEELRKYVISEIKQVWIQLEKDESSVFFEFVKNFYLLNPMDALVYMKKYIDNIESVHMNYQDIDRKTGKDYEYVNDDYIKMLSGLIYSEHLEYALDLFFGYFLKKPNLYMQFYHAASYHFAFNQNYLRNECIVQITFLKKIIEISERWENGFIRLFFFDIVPQFLGFGFKRIIRGRNNTKVNMYDNPLQYDESVCEYRKLIWEQLILLSLNKSNKNDICEILKGYGHRLSDYGKHIVQFDGVYICKIIQEILNPNSISDCLLVEQINKVFQYASYETDKLNLYLNNKKMNLYRKFDCENGRYISSIYEKNRVVSEFIINSENKKKVIDEIFETYLELEESHKPAYIFSNSINIMLKELYYDKDLFNYFALKILKSDHIEGLDIGMIVRKLFELKNSQDVFKFLSTSNLKNRNEWIYYYYLLLPEEFINKREVKKLYKFLEVYSSKQIKHNGYGSIEIFKKYLCVDKDVIVKSAKIIFKQRYKNPNIVEYYYSFMFNNRMFNTQEIIHLFRKDLNLLMDIYMYINDNVLLDYEGHFIYEMYQANNGILLKYLDHLIVKYNNRKKENYFKKLRIFFMHENYISIITLIVDKILDGLAPGLIFPLDIKDILDIDQNDKEYFIRFDTWIKQYIQKNCRNNLKMDYLFIAIRDYSLENKKEYIKIFCNNNTNVHDFKELPIVSRRGVHYGSIVPVINSDIEFLQSLLPLFKDIKFIEHKKFVLVWIEECKKFLENEELKEIIGYLQ